MATNVQLCYHASAHSSTTCTEPDCLSSLLHKTQIKQHTIHFGFIRSNKDKFGDRAVTHPSPAPTRPCLWRSRQILASMLAIQLHKATKRPHARDSNHQKLRPLTRSSVNAVNMRSLRGADRRRGHRETNAYRRTNTDLSLQHASTL